MTLCGPGIECPLCPELLWCMSQWKPLKPLLLAKILNQSNVVSTRLERLELTDV